MITPAYSLTATERVLPRMALDFTTGVLDPRVTFTRASTATFVGSNGLIQTAAINAPRFDYSPSTLAPLGLLIEESRINFVLQSNVITSNADVTVTAGAATSPDGTTNAYRTTKANATDPVYSSKSTSMTVTANTAYTVSRFVKYDGFNTTVSLEYNVGANWGNVFWNAQFAVASTGVTVSSQNSCTAAVQNFGNGWYRLTATFTTGAVIVTPSNPSILLRITGGSGVAVLGYGVQLEAGAFATSYIPTVASTVTRNPDVATMTGTNFSDWYNASEGALFAEASFIGRPATVGNARTAVISDGTTDNFISAGLRNNANSSGMYYGQVTTGGAGQALLPSPIATDIGNNVIFKSAIAYKVNNIAATANGATPSTDTSATIPTVNRLIIGGFEGVSNFLNGHMRSCRYYPQRLTNAELQAFSK